MTLRAPGRRAATSRPMCSMRPRRGAVPAPRSPVHLARFTSEIAWARAPPEWGCIGGLPPCSLLLCWLLGSPILPEHGLRAYGVFDARFGAFLFFPGLRRSCSIESGGRFPLEVKRARSRGTGPTVSDGRHVPNPGVLALPRLAGVRRRPRVPGHSIFLGRRAHPGVLASTQMGPARFRPPDVTKLLSYASRDFEKSLGFRVAIYVKGIIGPNSCYGCSGDGGLDYSCRFPASRQIVHWLGICYGPSGWPNRRR